jgi:hypothetical protein
MLTIFDEKGKIYTSVIIILKNGNPLVVREPVVEVLKSVGDAEIIETWEFEDNLEILACHYKILDRR